MDAFIFALLITTLAGLSTGIGGLIAVLVKQTNKNFLTFSLGFSAGVMIYVSFVEILPNSIKIATNVNDVYGEFYTVFAFFIGIAIIAIIGQTYSRK